MSSYALCGLDARFLVGPLFRVGAAPICSRINATSCEQISSQSAKPISAVEGVLLPRTPRFEILAESVGNG